MPTFALYKILFSRASQRSLLAEDGRTQLDHAQDYLEEVLTEKLPICKEQRDKTLLPLENYVETRRDRVSLMVVCNEKSHKYREKMKNLHLTNAGRYGRYYVGGIAATNYGTIEGCTVSGEITATESKVGGITGVNYGRIEGCSVTGKIEAVFGYAGGIAGENYGTIVACSNGTTIGRTYLSANVGGIAGYADGTNCTIIGCYNTGSISGTEHIGGILGYAANNITMTSCYNTGTVSSDDETSVGNMIGTNEGTATFQNCCWATGAGVGSGSENASWNGGGGSGTNNTGNEQWVTLGTVESMNSSLNNSGINWRYVANEDEATKEQEPYKLQKKVNQ